MVESGRKFIETYKKESKAKAAQKEAETVLPEPGDEKEDGTKDKAGADKEGGEGADAIKEEKAAGEPATENGTALSTVKADAKKDEYGLPIVSQDEDPELWKEANIVRTLIKQERSHGQWKK